MKFGYTILFVKSVPETLSFYERAFGFVRGKVNPAQTYGELLTGDTRLAFVSHEFASSFATSGFTRSTPSGTPPPIELGFTSSKVRKSYHDALKAGATALSEPKVMPWGQLVAYLRDNNGFLIEICEPVP